MNKKFDCVGFQREQRERLSAKYNKDREELLKEIKDEFGKESISPDYEVKSQ